MEIIHIGYQPAISLNLLTFIRENVVSSLGDETSSQYETSTILEVCNGSHEAFSEKEYLEMKILIKTHNLHYLEF